MRDKPTIKMDEVVKSQLLEVRATGKANMFDAIAVQRIAFRMGFHELVCFIETDRCAYISFVMTGKRVSE